MSYKENLLVYEGGDDLGEMLGGGGDEDAGLFWCYKNDKDNENAGKNRLKGAQVYRARQRIQDVFHPISKTYAEKAFPYYLCILSPILKVYRQYRQKKEVKEEERMQSMTKSAKIMKELLNKDNGLTDLQAAIAKQLQETQNKVKNQKLIENQEKDPFLKLGVGIVAYRTLLRTFVLLFFVLSLMALPVINIYKNGGGYTKDTTKYAHLSLGNMGFQSEQCAFVPLTMSMLSLQCEYGLITNMRNYGINTYNQTVRDACSVNEEFKNDYCSPIFKQQYMDYQFRTYCQGNQSCFIKTLEVDTGKLDNDLRSKEFETDDIYTNKSHPYHHCVDSRSGFFIQYSCESTIENTIQKYEQLSLVSCIFCFICAVFSLTIYFLKVNTNIQMVRFDFDTVTAGDYTIELEINQDMLQKFKEHHVWKQRIEEKQGAFGLCLKKYLMTQIEDKMFKCKTNRISDMKANNIDHKHLKLSTEDDALLNHEVADIVLLFDNHKLIKYLKERGQKIASGKIPQIGVCNKKINDYLQNGGKDQVCQVIGAFVTFKTEEGYNEAMRYIKNPSYLTGDQQNLLDNRFKLKDADEPSNIIWECKHIKGWKYYKRVILACVLIVIILAISFSVIVSLQIKSVHLENEYPKVDCTKLYGFYKNTRILKQAGNDYLEQKAIESKKSNFSLAPRVGALRCFCERQINNDFKKVNIYDLWNSRNNLHKFQDWDDNEQNEPICYYFAKNTTWAQFLSNICKYAVIIINTVIRMAIIEIIKEVGCGTHSKQSSLITICVFICQFFNTGFLMLLIDANFTQQGNWFFFQIFNGQQSDFNMNWYKKTGDTIVGSMMFNSYFTIILEGIFYLIRYLKRAWDRRGGVLTHCTSEQQYINLHAGPEYLVHFRYSMIMNITFITMMYGPGLPILFPIACFSFIVMNIMEVVFLYYVYKTPPAYDTKLHKSVLTQLQFASLFSVAFGFWQFSNHQLLPYEGIPLSEINRLTDAFQSNHLISRYITLNVEDIMKYSGPGLPFFITFISYAVYLIMRRPVKNIMKKMRINLFRHEDEIYEEFQPYFNNLDDFDKKWTIKEEEYIRENFMYSTMPESTLKNYKEGHLLKGHEHASIQGIHCYNILRNHKYIELFQYLTPSMDQDRNQFIRDDDGEDSNNMIQSDLVKIVFELPYMTKAQRDMFEFSEEGYLKLKAEAQPLNAIQDEDNYSTSKIGSDFDDSYDKESDD